jgi:hypothetical protein
MHKTSSVCLFLFVCCTSSLSILLIIDNKEQIHLMYVILVRPPKATHYTKHPYNSVILSVEMLEHLSILLDERNLGCLLWSNTTYKGVDLPL